ncbi:MAG: hypothetical protein GXP52_07680 [Deltaproteobacteria bacterium]|nr:hypothetical protein [Deltaproteobacteria bacterium]
MMKTFKTALLCILLITFSLSLGCEKTMDEDVVQPVKSMYNQKDTTMLKTAVANVRQVRSALMMYAAGSADSEYPKDTQVYDYDSLRKILASKSLPPDMADLMWDPAPGINYSSDGASFSLQVRALTKKNEIITATASSVKW